MSASDASQVHQVCHNVWGVRKEKQPKRAEPKLCREAVCSCKKEAENDRTDGEDKVKRQEYEIERPDDQNADCQEQSTPNEGRDDQHGTDKGRRFQKPPKRERKSNHM